MKRLLRLFALVALTAAQASFAQEAEPLVPPFTEDFSTEEGFDRFTVINANGDLGADTTDVTWYFDDDRLCASYTYNRVDATIGADDWLITPALRLESGRAYTLTFLVGCANNQGERMEVKLGTAPTAEGMTATILPPTDITDKLNFKTTFGKVYTFTDVSVPASGVYYIGFHAISPADHFRLMLDDISFTANPFDAAPAEVTNASATAAAKGALSATVAFTAPTLTLEGGQLSALDRIEVTRGDSLVKVFENPTPGAALSFVDAIEANGTYTWSITPYNASGFGGSVEVQTYVGIDIPLRPTSALAEDRQTSVGLSWQAVSERGVNGGYVDPETTHYIIYTMEGGYVVDELLTTEDGVLTASVELDTEAGSQELKQYAIAAVNEVGRSEYGVAALVVGASYRLPFEEHFAGGETQNYWFRYSTEGITPSFERLSADDDGYAYVMASSRAGAEARFVSGKISLRGAVSPALLFYHQGATSSKSSLIVEVQKADGSVDVLRTIDYAPQADDLEWAQVTLPLEKYLNERYVMVSFHFVGGDAESAVALDAITVRDLLEYDLSATLDLPESIEKGVASKLAFEVKNEGSEEADDYRVRLLVGGRTVLDSHVTEVLPAQQTRRFEVDYTLSPTVQAEQIAVQLFVDYDYDLNESDNTAEGVIIVKSSGYPVAENLQVKAEEGGTTLTWSQPSVTSRPVVEDFEGDEFEAFSRGGIADGVKEGQLGEWRLYDGDNTLTYRFDPQPLYDGAGERMAWQVFEPRLCYDMTSDLKRGYIAHSGNRYLISVQGTDGSASLASNDWLISPRLSGEEQEISFFAKEVSIAFEQEHFQLYYSTTGPNILNFVSCGEGRLESEKWTEQKFTVPAGTRYFAIRKVTEDGFGMFVDDFSYRISAGSIKAYRIYRDEVLIATVEGDDVLRYLDTEGGEHDYAITVLYSDGTESDAITASTKVGIYAPSTSPDTRSADLTTRDLLGRPVSTPTAHGVFIVNGTKVLK